MSSVRDSGCQEMFFTNKKKVSILFSVLEKTGALAPIVEIRGHLQGHRFESLWAHYLI